jgi:hypothetical protein
MVLDIFQISLKRGYCLQVRRSAYLRCTGDGGRGAINEGPLYHLGDVFTAPSPSLITVVNPTIRPGEAASSIQTESIVVSSANLLCISFSHDAA